MSSENFIKKGLFDRIIAKKGTRAYMHSRSTSGLTRESCLLSVVDIDIVCRLRSGPSVGT